MKNYIKIPNLPTKKVTSVLVDYRMNVTSIKKLNELGISVYKTRYTNSLYNAVSGHPDMVIHHLSDNRFIVSPENFDYFKSIPGIEIIIGKGRLKSSYPDDISYNAARVGDFLIHNFKYTDKNLLEQTEHLNKIDVKQGYSKCSVCVINKNSIITSDLGIAKKCDNYGIDVLFVDDSKIKLNGVSHGFIGGSCGLISPQLLAINGNLNQHTNCDEIQSFCAKYNVSIISLHNNKIEDIGSIICLTE